MGRDGRDAMLAKVQTGFEVILISRTTTAKGLQVTCRLDRRKYPNGRRVTKEEIGRVNLQQNKFYGEWNYAIHPSTHQPG
jgi:hypothetical protein